MKALLISMLLALMACDFASPESNDLMDLNQPVNIFNLFNTQASILRQPNNVDVTGATAWQYNGSEFQVSVTSQVTNTYVDDISSDHFETGFYPVNDVFLESRDLIEFTGFDSLMSDISIDVENTNPAVVGLQPVQVNLQVKAVGEDNYVNVEDVRHLLGEGISFRVRLHLRVQAGIPSQNVFLIVVNGQRISITEFYANTATYRINFNIRGLFL